MNDNTPHLFLPQWFYDEMEALAFFDPDPIKIAHPFRLCHRDPARTRCMADEFVRLELADVVFRTDTTVFMQPRPLLVLLCRSKPGEHNRLMIRDTMIAVVIPERDVD